MFEKEFVQHLLEDAKPYLKALIEEVLKEREGGEIICVDYQQAGRMIGTTYEGIRKMVRNGDLKATCRGRRRAIAISELKLYVIRKTQ